MIFNKKWRQIKCSEDILVLSMDVLCMWGLDIGILIPLWGPTTFKF